MLITGVCKKDKIKSEWGGNYQPADTISGKQIDLDFCTGEKD